MYHSFFAYCDGYWAFCKLLLPRLSVNDVPNEQGALVGLMTPQAVRRGDAYHVNSIEKQLNSE